MPPTQDASQAWNRLPSHKLKLHMEINASMVIARINMGYGI
jgi:hypothetical protein